MYRKCVQTVPNKIGVWLWELVSRAFFKQYLLGISAGPTNIAYNIPEDQSES